MVNIEGLIPGQRVLIEDDLDSIRKRKVSSFKKNYQGKVMTVRLIKESFRTVRMSRPEYVAIMEELEGFVWRAEDIACIIDDGLDNIDTNTFDCILSCI